MAVKSTAGSASSGSAGKRTPTRQRKGVQSLDRAVAILHTFSREHPQRGVTEIARITGLTPSTTHRILATLQEHRLVRKSQMGATYTLGPELLRLAYVAHDAVTLTEFARPIMEGLRDMTEETVALHIADSTPARIVLDQVESRQALRRTYTEVGHPVPIHQGAPGKLLLAHLPEEKREAVVSGRLDKATPRTIVEPKALRKELRKVREQGYALSLEERIPGITTVAVPVRDYSGIVMAISVSGPSSRVSRTRLMEILPLALSASQDLSELLGYQPTD